MFEGKVNLIKRNKLIHCGIKMWNGTEYIMTSVFNRMWKYDDKTNEGNSSEVTCKRCKKILDKADSKGQVKL
ncbi:hypothetical protein [Clostridium botulinum]|uniref:hypothetical protein n=1 Tax=Clostridium botulinum TaxID=1491 RepID=UPI00174BB7E5|nr:hypothetical protein [Clostridium botulinum]MBD5589282.1 hypothetical protein [Clostridium botulinum]